MTVYLAIAVLVGIDLVVWLMIRQFQRTGVILGSPWNINREQTPKQFIFCIVSFWVLLVVAVAWTVGFSFMILSMVKHA